MGDKLEIQMVGFKKGFGVAPKFVSSPKRRCYKNDNVFAP